MTPFDDDFGDPFEDIVREFFGGRKIKRNNFFMNNENDEREIDYLEDENYIYLIFELPGFNEKDVSVIIKGNELNIKAGKRESECEGEVQNYLIEKLCRENIIKRTLPKFVNTKNFKHSMRNGILEIMFSKK
ncbi:MAG: Hsp20/alpha crystallin family protein [Nanoarchaeota archaeon]